MTTTWPRRTVRTSPPTASTTPIASWPMRWPSTFGPPLYGHRSLPQMQARMMRMTASVGCWTVASGTSAIRTSCAFGMMVARIIGFSILGVRAGARGKVFIVGDMLHPGHGRAVQRLLDSDVGHGAGRCGAVPVLPVGRTPELVAGVELEL